MPPYKSPISFPIDIAVFILSPVSIFTSTPASNAVCIDSFTPSLKGSSIPTNPPKTKSSLFSYDLIFLFISNSLLEVIAISKSDLSTTL